MIQDIDYEVKKANELRKESQQFSIKIYMIILSLGLFGLIFSILRSTTLTKEEITFNIITVSALITIALIILTFAYRYKHNLDIVDWILVGINLSLYLLLVSLSKNNKIVNPSIWLPMFLMFVLSTFKFRHTLILIITHVIVAVYFLIKSPVYEITIGVDIYGYILTISIILVVVTWSFLNRINKFQQQIFNDYKEIDNKNMELTALNEEYYATQEELMSQYDEIHKLAFYDTLTKIHNRSGIEKVFKDLKFEDKTTHYLVLSDINKFREINNVYGYDLGDRVLIETSRFVQDKLNNVEAIGRIAGDVFLFIVHTDNTNGSLVDALNQMKSSISHGANDILISYNFGVAICDKKESFQENIRKVEIALSRAKELDSRHIYFYDEELSVDTENRVKLNHALEIAISNKTLYQNYQPIYLTKTKELYSFESLARWTHDEKGNIAPNIFIAIAESSNLIHSLGKNVTESSISFCKEALFRGFDGKVTINVSGRELVRYDFAQNFIKLVKQSELDPQHIAIEVTETSLLGNIELATKHLEILRSFGISIYLDDFGTGYSSLSYIDKLPIDVLKIDQSFIDQLLVNDKKKKLLRVIIDLAKELSIVTVAEGVETADQYDYLLKMDVDYVQGYYLSKPLSKEDALALL